MFGSRRGWRNVKGGTHKGMWRVLRKEEAISVHAANGLLLAHYEKGYNRICEKMPRLPSANQFDPHPPTKLT